MAKGPKPRGEHVGKSSVFTTRIRPDLRKRLDQAVKRSGRSLSQEVEERLTESFAEEDSIVEMFGDRRTFMLMRMMADAIHLLRQPADDPRDDPSAIRPPDDPHWLDDPATFDLAISCAFRILDLVRPEKSTPLDPLLVRSEPAHQIARSMWKSIKRADIALPLNQGTDYDHKKKKIKKGLAGLELRAFENDKPSLDGGDE
jgi:hypothetical protein